MGARGGEDVERVDCIVEIPKGSRNKYEWDKDLGRIKLDRMLFSSIVYPTDYGYIPETCAGDDDPLDVLVMVSEPTFPGCLIAARPVALFRMTDDKGPDEKILCVPDSDPTWSELATLEDVPSALRREIEHFFSVYKDLENKKVSVEGWESREKAIEVIEDSRERWRGLQEDGGEE